MNKIPLKNLCKKDQVGKYGIPASAEEFDLDKIRYLRISDIDDYGNLLNNDKKSVSSKDIDKYILEEGDLVVARTGNSTGRTYYHEKHNGKLAFAGFLIKYGLDYNKVFPKYLKYYTISSEYKQWVKNLSIGSTRGNINAQTFAECPISLPSRIQQEALVEILSKLDSKIELNNRINAELEAMAKTIYDYWFVQFDFPDKNGKPYKTSGGKMVWNEELKREIPVGWEVKELEEIATIKAGGDKPKYYTVERTEQNNIPIYSNGILNDGLYGYTINPVITDQSVTISARGTIGFCVLRNKPFVPIIRLITLTPKVKGSAKYFYETLRNFIFENSGSVQQQLTVPQVNRIKILYPAPEMINSFEGITSPLLHKIEIHKEENEQLAYLRDWLLPMLMNGQVRVDMPV